MKLEGLEIRREVGFRVRDAEFSSNMLPMARNGYRRNVAQFRYFLAGEPVANHSANHNFGRAQFYTLLR